MDNQLLPGKKPPESRTQGKREDSRAVPPENGLLHHPVQWIKDASQQDYCSHQPITSGYRGSAWEANTGRGSAQRHENKLADSSGTQLQPDWRQ